MNRVKPFLIGIVCVLAIAAICASAWFAYDARRRAKETRDDIASLGSHVASLSDDISSVQNSIDNLDTGGGDGPTATVDDVSSAVDNVQSYGLPARSSRARRNGRIVFAAPSRGRRVWMFTVNADGRDKKLLTRDGGISPRWSPDGTKLAFTRGDSLLVMRARPGATPRFLIKVPINGPAGSAGGIPGLDAHWSPDGRRITFATVRGIEVANADGSGRRLLLRTRPQQLFFGDPDWSPDGRQIVLDGTGWAPLTWPTYAPAQIYVMRPNGTGLRQLTEDTDYADDHPSWSPDGRWILFARCPAPWAASRAAELVLLKPDGSKQRTIARLPGSDCVRNIAWSPDGRKILYLSERTGVEVMNIDGSARKRLLPWALGVSGFSWQPLPKN